LRATRGGPRARQHEQELLRLVFAAPTAGVRRSSGADVAAVVGVDLVAEFDLQTPEFVAWGIERMGSRAFDDEKGAIARALLDVPLSRSEQAALCRVRPLFVGTLFFAPFAELLARQGDASLEAVGRLRDEMAASDDPLPVLDCILRITRPTADELDLLHRALRYGASADRLAALEMLARGGFDTSGFREDVERLRGDCVARVRERALELLRQGEVMR
jgi:hypothetical protein